MTPNVLVRLRNDQLARSAIRPIESEAVALVMHDALSQLLGALPDVLHHSLGLPWAKVELQSGSGVMHCYDLEDSFGFV